MVIARFAGLLIVDLAAFYTALFLASFTRANIAYFFLKDIATYDFSFEYYISIWWVPVIFIAIMIFERLYTSRYPFWEEIKTIMKAVSITILFVFFTIIVRSMYSNISRLVLLFLWIYLAFILILFRYWGKRLLYIIGIWKEKVLVLGTGESAVSTVKGLINEKQLGYDVVGFLYEGRKMKEIIIDGKKYPVFGEIKNFTKFARLLDISTVIISLPRLSRNELTKLTNHVQKYAKNVVLVPDLIGISLMNTELHYLFMEKIFLLKIKNNLHSFFNRLIKTVFDIILCILFMPFFLILVAVIVLFIKLDSKGPAFIIQDRVGKNDKLFRCIKFRTMYLDSERLFEDYLKSRPEASREWKKFKKLRGFDPRVTRVGRFLRKTSLDEMPQIFNVLRGEMSIVGPRPYLPREKEEIKDFKDIILLTKPGLTGLWQISGRNELVFEERLKLDTWYVENWSLWLDLIILFKTAGAVLKRKGAY